MIISRLVVMVGDVVLAKPIRFFVVVVVVVVFFFVVVVFSLGRECLICLIHQT